MLVCFRLLTEYHSFLLFSFDEMNEEEKTNSFRLLTEYHSFLCFFFSFSLFRRFFSFRLLTEYHSFLCMISLRYQRKKGGSVSVSLRSIIHSYKYRNTYTRSVDGYVSVSLRSIIHSYAGDKPKYEIKRLGVFPSPYGVSFILMFLF